MTTQNLSTLNQRELLYRQQRGQISAQQAADELRRRQSAERERQRILNQSQIARERLQSVQELQRAEARTLATPEARSFARESFAREQVRRVALRPSQAATIRSLTPPTPPKVPIRATIATERPGEQYSVSERQYTPTQRQALNRLKPYTDTQGRVDIARAFDSGVKPQVLENAGFTKLQIAQSLAGPKKVDLVAELNKGAAPKSLLSQGFKGEDVKRAQLKVLADRQLKRYESGGGVDIGAALYNGVPAKVLRDAGFAPRDIAKAQKAVREEQTTPRIVKFAKGVRESALDITPVYGTIRTWDRSSNLQRGINIASDILTIIPIAGGTTAGVRAGEKVIPAITKSVVREAIAPITAIRRPVQTAKAALDPLEVALRPSRIPLAATSIRDTTIRIPLASTREFASIAKAQKDVSAVTIDAIRSGKGVGTVGQGGKLKISRIGLRKVSAEPVAVHSTPDIRAFQQGVKIEGREGGLYVSPSLHSRFTYTSAFGDAPKGGVPGALIIRDPKIASTLKSSGKTFKNQIEIEAVIPSGTTLPAPSQYLITRDPAGRKLVLAIIGKPYSASEIAKLKLLGSAEAVTQIFRNPARLGRTVQGVRLSKAFDRTVNIRRDIEEATSALTEARKARNATRVKELDSELGNLRRELERANDRVAALGSARFAGRVAAAYYGDQDIAKALRAAGKAPQILRTPKASIAGRGKSLSTEPPRGKPSTAKRSRVPSSVSVIKKPTRKIPERGTERGAPSRPPAVKPPSKGRIGAPTTSRPPGVKPPGRRPPSSPPRRPPSSPPRRPPSSPPRRPLPPPTRTPVPTPPTRTPVPTPPTNRVPGPPSRRRPPSFEAPPPSGPRPTYDLPGNAEKQLKRGYFPRVVTHRQGLFNITTDLDTGRQTFDRARGSGKGTTPAKTFRVVTQDKTRPPSRDYALGVVTLEVQPNRVSFRRRLRGKEKKL